LIVVGYDPLESDPPRLDPIQATSSRANVRDAIADLSGTCAPQACKRGFDWWRYGTPPSLSPYAIACRRLPPGDLGASWAKERLRQGQVSGMRRITHSVTVQSRFAQIAPGKLDPVGRHPRLDWEGFCPALRAGTGFENGRYQSVRPNPSGRASGDHGPRGCAPPGLSGLVPVPSHDLAQLSYDRQ
jgi:DNA (cytosine-5)-methyltransferase 1